MRLLDINSKLVALTHKPLADGQVNEVRQIEILMKKFVIEGQIEIEGHGWLFIDKPTSSDSLAALLVGHFSPSRLHSKYEREMLAVQKIRLLDGLPPDSSERRRIVEEIEQLIEDYSNYFQITFEPLADQGEKLILRGYLIVEGTEMTFESSRRSGFLGAILLEHFRPGLSSNRDNNSEDEESIGLGPFRIVFEQISEKV